MQSSRLLIVVLVASAAIAASGCHKDEVRVIEVPKDIPSTASAKPEAKPEAPPREERTTVPWTVPSGWKEKANESGMRMASYAVVSPDGRSVDISVVALGEKAGSELDNVNRWRQQLKLSTVEAGALAALQAPVKIGQSKGVIYDLASDEKVIDDKYRGRTLAVMWPVGNLTVFFKAFGEDALVAENKAKFIGWVASVKTGPGDGEETARPAPASPAPDVSAAPPAGADGLPEWQVPSGWKTAGQKPMRLASFEIAADGGVPGDVSVSSFSGAAGGLLANVNRWRGQIGIAPTDETTLAKDSKPLKLAGGGSGTLVDLAGGKERILGAIVPSGDKTWFFKLKGDDALVSRERANFVKFVESVKL